MAVIEHQKIICTFSTERQYPSAWPETATPSRVFGT
jgi:hypothetical protein